MVGWGWGGSFFFCISAGGVVCQRLIFAAVCCRGLWPLQAELELEFQKSTQMIYYNMI